jgi:LmbE family N-acetylglucosaminyl deacetylase
MGAYLLLSPHLDDAVFSCGGWMAQRSAAGDDVLVVTICAGDPPAGPLTPFAQALHHVWGDPVSPVAARRTEDLIATGRLGALARQLDIPDAIYRKGPEGDPLYPDEASIFGGLHPAEQDMVQRLAQLLLQTCASGWQVLCPLAIGGHVDHLLSRQAAEQTGVDLWYYRDLPYDARSGSLPAALGMPPGSERILPLAPEEIEAWAQAAAEYHSQLSSFWVDAADLYRDLLAYHDSQGGIRLLMSGSVLSAQGVPSP